MRAKLFKHILTTSRVACAAVMFASFTTTALAGEEPYGQPINGWTFTQEATGGQIKCRGKLKIGNDLFIFGAMTGGGKSYISNNSGILKPGKYPRATLVIGDSKSDVTVNSGGGRMWTIIEDFDMDKIATAGGYVLNIPLPGGKFGGGEINLNKAAPRALNNVYACVKANGG